MIVLRSMLRLVALCLVLVLLAVPGMAATITSAQTGSWSSTATWAGGVVPVAGDDVVVAPGHVVTLGAAVTIEKTLTINGKLDTATYALTIGNGASKDGYLTLGPGAELALGSGGMVLNNCALLSTATSANWAKVTGTGAITRGSVYTAPKQRIVPSYVSFQTTGAITLGAGNFSSYGSVANPTLDLTRTCFVGTGALTFGQDGWASQNATDMIFRYVDFRNTGNITIRGYNGAVTGQTVWESVTLSHSTSRINVSVIGRPGIDFTNTVFDSAAWGYYSPHGQGGGHDLLGVFFRQYNGRAATGDSFVAFGATSSVASGKMQDSYAHSNLQNTHGVDAGGTGAPAAPIYVDGNVFEFQSIDSPTFNDSGNFVLYGNPRLYVRNNITLGTAVNFVGAAGPYASPQGFDVTRNTVYCASRKSYPTVVQALGLYELGAEAYSGTDAWHSNLVHGDVPLEYGIHDNNESTKETVTYSDYNWFSNVTQAYKGVTVSGRAFEAAGPNDKTGAAATDPQFIDKTRCLSAYAVHKGWASAGQTRLEKEDVATAKLLAINGYDAATKTQGASPSGASISDMVAWVRAGFAPQNQALKAAGKDGVDIGAVAVAAIPVIVPGGISPWGAAPWGAAPWGNGTTPWGAKRWGGN